MFTWYLGSISAAFSSPVSSLPGTVWHEICAGLNFAVFPQSAKIDPEKK